MNDILPPDSARWEWFEAKVRDLGVSEGVLQTDGAVSVTVARAMADAIVYEAFSAEYIANLLEARQRQLPEPGALHLTRRQDLLDLELPAADLGLYEANPENADENP